MSDKKVTLVIMAAGMGSRYGKGMKQLANVGPNGEIIMDYSIYDAVRAGVSKVVFIIRKDFEEQFRESIGDRISKLVPTDYVYQHTDMLPEGFTAPERTKPWGTGHAILCCKGVVNEPFIIINADDFYGSSAFTSLIDFLRGNDDETALGMAGFILKNTLSDNGTVTRGVCEVDDKNYLRSVKETFEIKRGDDGIVRSLKTDEVLDENSYVSMNMWACYPKFIDELEDRFKEFLSENINDLKAEYLLPFIIEDMLKKGETSVKVFETGDKWFGVTYAEDTQLFRDSILELINEGKYPYSIIK